MTHDAVPERYRGVWSRTLLETPTHRDESSLVLWMQTDCWHADLRIPESARVDRIKATLAEMSSLQLQALALQNGFCGITQVERRSPDEDEVCTWHRHADYQPTGLTPDAGWMLFETDERVIETGVHGVYREVWERLPGSTGHFSAQILQEGDDPARATRLLTAGRFVMRVRPRQTNWPASTALGDTLGEVLIRHPDEALRLLDFEISFGLRDKNEECQHWIILHSTLPELEGQTQAR